MTSEEAADFFIHDGLSGIVVRLNNGMIGEIIGAAKRRKT